MAHISGGGLVENIPRILPQDCAVELKKGGWSILPVFEVMQDIGNITEPEMYRTFNMGIGMVLIVSVSAQDKIVSVLKHKIKVFKLGKVVAGKPEVILL